MGMFFSNIHVKKKEGFSKDDLIAVLTEDLLSKGFKRLENGENVESWDRRLDQFRSSI